ncbi:CopG family transcriptional regulator [Citrobacter freundii]|uniref:hypothetical protein n=1 Tax=Enterobacteriaceae TaxID=543 RepID=UPI00026F106D|nr:MULTISPECIES: hypothetical protein [Enterobacteriaceae]EBU5388151.1 CopG family transcriptional regulator [Salmonella enterica subsp. enterica]ECB5827297.1 CopG family transcriptional regulator [Salmonella enterica subsp. enterica serovar Montevideo]ECG0615024.1 CopG family transcriptional regulator [Salmonella enterica]EKW5160961.1 hypothetical protein [Pseudomonas aeruginosa]MDB8048366.1 CopG family transcriptional regulator [Escherichia coli]HBS6079108.1 CopG family transcriptional regu
MSIQRKPKTANPREAAAEAFVTGAPDAAASKPTTYEKGLPKGKKRQISLTIAPELLRKVDERAERAGIGRAAFISMAIFKALEES